jgi:hypothetical protein
MKLTHTKTIVILFILTTIMALSAHYAYGLSFFVTLILGLSAIKFILVVFQFMEMKNANGFWKFFIIFYLIAFVSVVSLVVS